MGKTGFPSRYQRFDGRRGVPNVQPILRDLCDLRGSNKQSFAFLASFAVRLFAIVSQRQQTLAHPAQASAQRRSRPATLGVAMLQRRSRLQLERTR